MYNWQFTIGCLRLDYSKIIISLSLRYPNSYFYNKRCNMLPNGYNIFYIVNVAVFCQCQCHSSCLTTWSIRRSKSQGNSWRGLKISTMCNFCSFLSSSSRIFLCTALLLRLDSKATVNSRTYRDLD